MQPTTQPTTTTPPHDEPAAAPSPAGSSPRSWDVGIVGAGSAASTLVSRLGGDTSVVVFESERVGGKCPFVACMPSKSMLHDAAVDASWPAAVRRRSRIVEGLDDSAHADSIRGSGAELVRARARIRDAHTVVADGVEHRVAHLVIASGSRAVVPPIAGIDDLGDRRWTSDDATTAHELPSRLVVLGGGVVGCELATAFARFGVAVDLIDAEPVAFGDLGDRIGPIVDAALRRHGVAVHRDTEVDAVARRRSRSGSHDEAVVTLGDGEELTADRLLVATGRIPSLDGLGVERLGLDPDEPLPVDPTGRVDVDGSVWAIGDVAGRGQYTHVANHHAAVVADHLTGGRSRTFDEVVTPACVFTDPPIVTVGPTPADLAGDDDVVWASADLDRVARWTTDELGAGHLMLAARRSTGCLVAGHGVGARFDDLAAPLVVAIDGGVPVGRLASSMHPFPTIGELFGAVVGDLAARLDR